MAGEARWHMSSVSPGFKLNPDMLETLLSALTLPDHALRGRFGPLAGAYSYMSNLPRRCNATQRLLVPRSRPGSVQ